MTDFSRLVTGILAVAEKVAPMVFPQAGVAIEVGKALADLFDEAKATVAADPDEVARLEAGREAFEARVAANVGGAADALRGH